MSWARIVYLHCDECGAVWSDAPGPTLSDSDVPGDTVSDQRRDARRNGWVLRAGLDLCESCR